MILAWSNSFTAPFEFDDHTSIIDNASIRHLWSFGWLRPPATAGETVSGRPVLNFTLAVNYALGGLDVRGYHLVNMLLHAAAALTLFGIVCRTAGRTKPPAEPPSPIRLGETPRPTSITGPGLALAVALLWALHPLQTAAVTYVIQRAEVLAALFLLLTLYCFVRGARAEASRPWFTLAFVSCLLGMGTKETMAAAPLIVLLYDRAFLSGSFRAAWQARGRMHLALMATWLLLAVLLAANHDRGGSAGLGAAISPWAYFLTQCDAIVHYLALACWPGSQVFDYGIATVAGFGAVWWQFLFLAGLGTVTLWLLGRNRPLGFVGACFFLLLGPSSSIVPVATQTMAEHRVYLALATVILLVALLLKSVLRRANAPAYAGVVLAVVAALALGAATFARNQVYGSDLTLWQDTVQKRPDNPRAHHNLGTALLHAGRTDEAVAEFQRTIALQPEHAFAHFSLGTIALGRRQWAGAAAQFEAALAADPHYVAARIDYGQALTQLGRTAEAVAQYQAALADEPNANDARTNLASLLMGQGRTAEATAMLRDVVAAAPELAEAHFHLGRALEATDAAAAEAEFREAVRLKPAFAPGYLALGNLLARRGAATEAETAYREALRLDPGSTEAHYGLGNLYAKQQRFDVAMTAYREALTIDPSHAQARANLANCQLMVGQLDDAIGNYEIVLRARPDDAAVKRNLEVARELRQQRATGRP